jgi:hypothetical protein
VIEQDITELKSDIAVLKTKIEEMRANENPLAR